MKQNINNKHFKSPLFGTDPITKGYFTIDWAFVSQGLLWSEFLFGLGQTETLRAVGHITIDGKSPNPFYDALIKTPLLIQDHPLSVEFKDGMRFIKITKVGQWLITPLPKIELSDVEFDFLDNLNYLESITNFKDQNLL